MHKEFGCTFSVPSHSYSAGLCPYSYNVHAGPGLLDSIKLELSFWQLIHLLDS